MKYLILLFLFACGDGNRTVTPDPLPIPTPTPVGSVDLKLPYTTTWSLQYDKYPFVHNGRQAYVGDMWGTPKEEIDRLHAQGALVYAYFSTQAEDWRPDFHLFPKEDIGPSLDGWDGEYFVNTRSQAIRRIMQLRMDKAKELGFDGIDPDNTDGYLFAAQGLPVSPIRRGRRVDGVDDRPKTLRNLEYRDHPQMLAEFDMSMGAYIDYYLFLAAEAHARGLRITLKNSMDMIPHLGDVPDSFQNEQCSKYKECHTYDSIQGRRSIHMIEYSLLCPRNPYPKAFITKRTNMARGETVCQIP